MSHLPGTRLSPQKVFRISLIIIGILLALHAAVCAVWLLGPGPNYRRRLLEMFNLDKEGNLPAFFSGLQLFIAGWVGLTLARVTRIARDARNWYLLAGGMFFMAFDEVARIHEMGNKLTTSHMQISSPWLAFAWVIPGGIVVAGLGLFFIAFLVRLPRPVAFGLVSSGFVFVLGSIGVETLGAYTFTRWGPFSLAYCGATALEEGLEMLGIAMYVRTCLRYLAEVHGVLELNWVTGVVPESSPRPSLAGRE